MFNIEWFRSLTNWGSFLNIKKSCMEMVWPIRGLLITVSFFLFRFGFIHLYVSCFILFSLVHRFPYTICHLLLIISLMLFFESSKDIFPIVGIGVLFIVNNACSSAILLLFIPEWPGIHSIVICLPCSKVLFKKIWICIVIYLVSNWFCIFVIVLESH